MAVNGDNYRPTPSRECYPSEAAMLSFSCMGLMIEQFSGGMRGDSRISTKIKNFTFFV